MLSQRIGPRLAHIQRCLRPEGAGVRVHLRGERGVQGGASVAARPRLQTGDGRGGGASQQGGRGRRPVGKVEEGSGLPRRGCSVKTVVDRGSRGSEGHGICVVQPVVRQAKSSCWRVLG